LQWSCGTNKERTPSPSGNGGDITRRKRQERKHRALLAVAVIAQQNKRAGMRQSVAANPQQNPKREEKKIQQRRPNKNTTEGTTSEAEVNHKGTRPEAPSQERDRASMLFPLIEGRKTGRRGLCSEMEL